MPQVSIIVPIYNVEPYLKRCIDSILNQTFSDFDLILVDDGSPDACPEICDKYASMDSRIHVIHQNNQGLSAARNSGLEWSFQYSDSKWICFIDSDDWVDQDYLHILYDLVNYRSCDIAICQYRIVSDDSNYYGDHFEDSSFLISGLEAQKFNVKVPVTVWTKLYKKELWKSLRFPIGKQHEDEFITWKVLLRCDNIIVSNRKLYNYYQRSESIMGRPYDIRRLDVFEAYTERIKFYCRDLQQYKFCAYPLSITAESHLAKIWENNMKTKSDSKLYREIKKKYRRLVVASFPLWPKKFWLERIIYSISPNLLYSISKLLHFRKQT